jgi:hypothetical protein
MYIRITGSRKKGADQQKRLSALGRRRLLQCEMVRNNHWIKANVENNIG